MIKSKECKACGVIYSPRHYPACPKCEHSHAVRWVLHHMKRVKSHAQQTQQRGGTASYQQVRDYDGSHGNIPPFLDRTAANKPITPRHVRFA